MNFDTRTVIDLIHLDDKLKYGIQTIIDEELFLFPHTDMFTDEEFVITIKPLVYDYLKKFLKTELKRMDLFFLKSMINLDTIDYKIIIDYVTKI